MTSEDIRSELERIEFLPFRLHLTSGKTVEVPSREIAVMLQNAVMVFHGRAHRRYDPRYDVIALRNIERLEQIESDEEPLSSQGRSGSES